MRLTCLAWIALALLPGLAGCSGGNGAAAQPTGPSLEEPRQAQPRLPTMQLWLGSQTLTAELALNNEQRMAGMMFRTNLADGAGMLFVFGTPHRAAFWMKNTPLPLDAAYLDAEGVIREIHALQPGSTNSVTATSDQIQYVLEVRQGWFRDRNLAPGTVVRTERGALADTFRSAR